MMVVVVVATVVIIAVLMQCNRRAAPVCPFSPVTRNILPYTCATCSAQPSRPKGRGGERARARAGHSTDRSAAPPLAAAMGENFSCSTHCAPSCVSRGHALGAEPPAELASAARPYT